MKDEQLIGFISGAITNPSEIEAIVAWIEASPENRKQYNNLLNSWAISGIVLESCDLNLDYSFSQLKKKKFGLYAILNYLKYKSHKNLSFQSFFHYLKHSLKPVYQSV